jgi:hypothetical protein
MTDLIEKLQSAEGPSRELDAEIFEYLGYHVKRLSTFPITGAFLAYPPAGPEVCRPADLSVTSTVGAALSLVASELPGWGWRIGSCHLSDDALLFPDFNCPEHGARLKAELGAFDAGDWRDTGIDIDLRPPGRIAIAIMIALIEVKQRLKSLGDAAQ